MQDKEFEDALHILHCIAIRDSSLDSAIYNILIGGLCKAGKLEKAHILYKKLLDKGHRPSNAISSTLINGHLRTDNIEVARETVNEITKNDFTKLAANLNALINALCKVGRVEHARMSLMEMKKPDIVCYITLIGGLCKLGMVDEAVNQLEKMISNGRTPAYALYSSLIKAFLQIKES